MRIATICALLAAFAAGIYVAQREKQQPVVDAAPLLNVVGDVQRTMSRVPSAASRPGEADEVAIGRALAARHIRMQGTALEQYVARVGSGIAAGAHRRMPYTFTVIDAPHMVNAFALPGGPVFIGTGLIALMQTEDELAAVLAHEVEHIDHYHCIDRYQSERMAAHVPVVGIIAMIPVEVFAAGYSKTQELEADMEGTRLAYRAGYSPLGAVWLLDRMAQRRDQSTGSGERRPRTPLNEVAQVPGSALDAYFRSHPPAPERIARVRDVARDDRLDVSRTPRPLEQIGQSGVQPDVTSR